MNHRIDASLECVTDQWLNVLAVNGIYKNDDQQTGN